MMHDDDKKCIMDIYQMIPGYNIIFPINLASQANILLKIQKLIETRYHLEPQSGMYEFTDDTKANHISDSDDKNLIMTIYSEIPGFKKITQSYCAEGLLSIQQKIEAHCNLDPQLDEYEPDDFEEKEDERDFILNIYDLLPGYKTMYSAYSITDLRELVGKIQTKIESYFHFERQWRDYTPAFHPSRTPPTSDTEA